MNFLDKFVNNSQISNFMKICPMGAKCGQTDMTKLSLFAIWLTRLKMYNDINRRTTGMEMTRKENTHSTAVRIGKVLTFKFQVLTYFSKLTTHFGGTRWRSWLRHCATSRKVAGSIPDGVTGIFHWHYPSGRTMALRSTQPLTEMSTRNVSWG